MEEDGLPSDLHTVSCPSWLAEFRQWSISLRMVIVKNRVCVPHVRLTSGPDGRAGEKREIQPDQAAGQNRKRQDAGNCPQRTQKKPCRQGSAGLCGENTYHRQAYGYSVLIQSYWSVSLMVTAPLQSAKRAPSWNPAVNRKASGNTRSACASSANSVLQRPSSIRTGHD